MLSLSAGSWPRPALKSALILHLSSTMTHPPPHNALWGQLLRKDTFATPAVPLPPTAPLDKTGTSMRILLHDTQANFERFSTRVDTLTEGIDEAKRDIIMVKDLFQGAQETLTLDIVDLVNRSQTQIQKTVCEPAQANALEQFRKDVDVRLDGLSKRIDDMQAFNQTQSQALQNVAQTLQSLQDQQGKVLSALLPLLPLLEAVPVHINSARSSINETMLKASLDSSRSHRTPPHIWPQPPQVIRKRSFPAGPPSSPLLARKRPRLNDESIESEHTPKNSGDCDPSPRAASRQPSFPDTAPYFTLSGPGCPPVPRPSDRTPSFPKRIAPRRPLGDLPIPVNARNEEFGDVRSPPSPKDQSLSSATRALLISPSLSRPIPQSDSGIPRNPPPLDAPSTNNIPPPQRHAEPDPAPTITPSNQLPNHSALPGVLPTVRDGKSTTSSNPPISLLPRHLSVEPTAQIVANTVVLQQQPVPVPTKFTMTRGRRSPFRDGRRFIPLDDDDDDSDDD
ncbi:hypothetical protein DFH06DRAFT_1464214 [Mycena polygramma]|nr:hypothetical protein DFH06DRAFT_1464214 [Mycena polygramma]